jgi:hypothetical protein
MIISDNGSELTSNAILAWAGQSRVAGQADAECFYRRGSRAHFQFGWKMPSEFAFAFHRDGILRCATPSAPRQLPSLTPPEKAPQTPEATEVSLTFIIWRSRCNCPGQNDQTDDPKTGQTDGDHFENPVSISHVLARPTWHN